MTVGTGAGVRRVDPRFAGVRPAPRDAAGRHVSETADHLVLAVPHHRAADLVPDDFAEAAGLTAAATLETAAISSVHVWFDREITPLPHVVLPERTSQWVFNRTRLHSPPREPGAQAPAVRRSASPSAAPTAEACASGSGGGSGWYFQVVISASDAAERPAVGTEVIAEVLGELRVAFPAARTGGGEARPHGDGTAKPSSPRCRGITPGARRPGRRRTRGCIWPGITPRPGGRRRWRGPSAAGTPPPRACLAAAGRPEPLVRPDLPAGRLSRWLGFDVRRAEPGRRSRSGRSPFGPPRRQTGGPPAGSSVFRLPTPQARRDLASRVNRLRRLSPAARQFAVAGTMLIVLTGAGTVGFRA